MGGLGKPTLIFKELPPHPPASNGGRNQGRKRMPCQGHQPVRGRLRQALAPRALTGGIPGCLTGGQGQVNKERKGGRELALPMALPQGSSRTPLLPPTMACTAPPTLQFWNDCFMGCPAHLGALPPYRLSLSLKPCTQEGPSKHWRELFLEATWPSPIVCNRSHPHHPTQ